MKFAYQAVDSTGKAVSDTVEAAGQTEALDALRKRGIYVSEIRPASGATPTGPATAGGGGGARPGGAAAPRRRRLGTGRRLKNMAMFTRQLSVLVASGTPLVQALAALERQTKDAAWREVVARVRLRVEEGSTLSDAMGEEPRVFDAVTRSLISAGESGGSFDVMLDRLAVLSRKQLHVRSAIVGALVYPALLICVAVCVLLLMLLFVLPRFAGLFETLDVKLPPMTQALMACSEFLQAYWWSLPLVAVAAGLAVRSWLGTEAGRRTVDAAVLRMPAVGAVVRSFAVARIARVLGVLLAGRVPLLEALGLARQTVSNYKYVELVTRAEEAVTRGSNVSTVFSTTDLVSPALCEAIRAGEQSGQIGPLLLNIADFLDEENEVIVKSLTSILEPIILVVLGVVVGVVALSMFMPLFDLTSAAHG
jgi:type IV pilus assembly protein PilC